jgi:hypothetical protein
MNPVFACLYSPQIFSAVVLGLALTGSVTQFVKITVGRPRPDIIDRCQPPAGSADPPFGLTDWTICTQTDIKILRDGFRSFPSGHSSMSFAGLGFLSFYLAGKLHLFDKRGHAVRPSIHIFTPIFHSILSIFMTGQSMGVPLPVLRRRPRRHLPLYGLQTPLARHPSRLPPRRHPLLLRLPPILPLPLLRSLTQTVQPSYQERR